MNVPSTVPLADFISLFIIQKTQQTCDFLANAIRQRRAKVDHDLEIVRLVAGVKFNKNADARKECK